MTLKELIKWLKKQDAEMVVKDGFSSPHSDRGDYEDLAFTPESEAKIGDMLMHATSALNNTFRGWKGGDFKMDDYTNVHIGEYGDCGEEITSTHFKYWLITGSNHGDK